MAADQCPVCLSAPHRPCALSCGHVLCRSCAPGAPGAPTVMACPVCRAVGPIAVERLYFGARAPEEVPKRSAANCMARVLRAAQDRRAEDAARHFRTFVVFSVLRDPSFMSLAVRAAPSSPLATALPPLAPSVLAEVQSTAEWVTYFFPPDAHEARLRWAQLSSAAITGLGAGCDVWRQAGVQRQMLDALDFFRCDKERDSDSDSDGPMAAEDGEAT